MPARIQSRAPRPEETPPGDPPRILRLFDEPLPPDSLPADDRAAGELSAESSLCELFFSYFLPDHLQATGKAKGTVAKYTTALLHWHEATSGLRPPVRPPEDYAFADPPLRQITSRTTADYSRWLQRRMQKASSAIGYIRHTRWVYEAALPRSWQRRNKPARGLLLPEEICYDWPEPEDDADDHSDECYTFEELSAILDACRLARPFRGLRVPPKIYWQSKLLYMANTGRRIKEVMTLRWDWIDLAAREVRYPRQGIKKKAKLFPLSSHATAALEMMLPYKSLGDGRVWPHPTWSHETNRGSLSKRFREICRAAGVRRLKKPFHGLRGYVGMELVAFNAIAAQKALGHHTSQLLSARYTDQTLTRSGLESIRQPRAGGD